MGRIVAAHSISEPFYQRTFTRWPPSNRQLKKGGGVPIPVFSGGGGGSGGFGSCISENDYMQENYMLDSFYSLGDSSPNALFCGPRNGFKCVLELSPERDFPNWFPCTMCELTYPTEATKSCQDYSCDIFECLQQNETMTGAQSVNVCTEVTRAEFLIIGRLNNTSCRVNFIQRSITKHFTSGVTNIRKVSWLMKKQAVLAGEETPDAFDACEVLVDGVECNSCQMCDDSLDLGIFAADCENISPGATVTCEDSDSFAVLEASPSALILQDGVEFPVELEQQSTASAANTVASHYGAVLVPLALLVLVF